MDDFLSLLLVAAIYLFAAFSKAKKKEKRGKKQQRSPMRSRTQGERRDVRAAARDQQTHTGFGDAFETRQKVAESTEHSCSDVRQMHLHEVSQRQFEHAGEGEDPCHAGQSDLTDDEPFDVLETANNEALAQDVLRGVIMSEILARPYERAAMRRGRR